MENKNQSETMESKPKPIFTQNEHGKFENKTTCETSAVVDIDELKRENKLLKEKLSAIRAESDVSNGKPRVTISNEETHYTSKASPRLHNDCSNENHCHPCTPPVLPCHYNPMCYSRNTSMHNDSCDCAEQEHLMDMMHRYHDYYPYTPYRSQVNRTKSCEDVNRLVERNILYNQIANIRPRSRARSVDGSRPTSSRIRTRSSRPHSRTKSYEDTGFSGFSFRWNEDPYFPDRWKCSGLARIPFRPRSTLDISVGMKVSINRSDGRLSRGAVRWIGILPNLPGEYIGVELETQTGKHDGYLNGIRYFKCRDNCGIFVKFSKIIMAWK